VAGDRGVTEDLDEALGALERAVIIEETSPNEDRGGGKNGRNRRNADFLRSRIEECRNIVLNGDKVGSKNGSACVETLKDLVRKGIEAGARRIQTHSSAPSGDSFAAPTSTQGRSEL
jgi:hypothetical protein